MTPPNPPPLPVDTERADAPPESPTDVHPSQIGALPVADPTKAPRGETELR